MVLAPFLVLVVAVADEHWRPGEVGLDSCRLRQLVAVDGRTKKSVSRFWRMSPRDDRRRAYPVGYGD